ncbi:DNA translocase FtsK [Lactococcus termiticola]|uniref:DNA translocase FtsK n=1 Tax=Lactococcus termiticola TaxID=2169526 RepID=A0A2R5HK54_9LACT|nr:DNA translocase FtsK [Lactococcus termiticola]GBG97140.1 cell division protein FtsK [Lactococcus termiticola]
MPAKKKPAQKKSPAKKSTKSKSSRTSAKKNRAATEKMIAFLIALFLIFFALTRLGIFGLLLYNISRLLTGSLAILALLLTAAYMIVRVFKKDFFAEHKRLLPGSLLVFVSLLLFFAYELDRKTGLNNPWILLTSDLTHFKVSHFAGAGMLGALFYIPGKTIFSEIGVIIVAVLLLLIGLYLMMPSLVSKARVALKESYAKSQEKKAEAKRQAELDAQNEKLKAITTPEPVIQEGVIQEPAIPEVTEPEKFEVPIDIPVPPFMENQLEEVTEEEVFPATETEIDFAPEAFQRRYALPTIDLMAEVPIKNQSGERERVRTNIKVLEETFKSFGIAATVESAVVGPSVTKYEIKLATGVKVSRVVNLSDDLALALAAQDVRIEAPIPGKSLVGIEIPNAEVATVGFRELWENGKTDPAKLIEVPLGKALDGTIKTFDLARMPHLLVAGSTGSGKSVAVNGIITSILMKAHPTEVKFLMVDPKMVELSVYNDIPHLLIPVVTNPRKAARALQKVVDEMEDRYEKFSASGVRNLEGYNAKIEQFNAQSEEKMMPLPLIVVIVDELADLMMVASKEVEDAIIRLGQKARAAGIHMILATQRPSVDVISGLIKANVPSRVAFAVSSGTDSRTIIDQNGAEKLLGRGDMLFKPIDANHPMRLQGAFLSDDDVEAVVTFIKNQSTAEYDERFDPGEAAEDDNRTAGSTAGGGLSGDYADPLFEQAKTMVITAQKASTAQLQRALKIGFNRASELMADLESAGVVGPAKGTTPRKVLITADGEIQEENQ